MTHLSDYSYIDRGVAVSCILIWAIIRVHVVDKWRSFNMQALRSYKLRLWATLLILLSLLLMLTNDVIVAYVKYSEGYVVTSIPSYDPSTPLTFPFQASVKTAPHSFYSNFHSNLILASELLNNFSMSLKASAMMMLLAQYNHTITRKLCESFTSSREAIMFRIAAVLSLGLYPAIQLSLQGSELMWSTIGPQFVYNFECLFGATCLQVTNYRFRQLLTAHPEPRRMTITAQHQRNITSNNAGFERTRLEMLYFLTLNNILTLTNLIDFTALIAINIDIVAEVNVIYASKVLTDLLAHIYIVAFCASYVLIIVILYPSRITIAASTQVMSDDVEGTKQLTSTEQALALALNGARRGTNADFAFSNRRGTIQQPSNASWDESQLTERPLLDPTSRDSLNPMLGSPSHRGIAVPRRTTLGSPMFGSPRSARINLQPKRATNSSTNATLLQTTSTTVNAGSAPPSTEKLSRTLNNFSSAAIVPEECALPSPALVGIRVNRQPIEWAYPEPSDSDTTMLRHTTADASPS